jgi:hypothetical protein
MGWQKKTKDMEDGDEMEIKDEDAAVLKAALKRVYEGIGCLKRWSEFMMKLINEFAEKDLDSNSSEFVRKVAVQASNSSKRISELSQDASLMYWRIKSAPLLYGKMWRPSVGDKIVGQVVRFSDSYQKKFIIVQKEGGELITIFLVHVDLKEKIVSLMPILGKRIIVQLLDNRHRKKYFVMEVPWGSKVA